MRMEHRMILNKKSNRLQFGGRGARQLTLNFKKPYQNSNKVTKFQPASTIEIPKLKSRQKTIAL
jgi:hypothetical protein